MALQLLRVASPSYADQRVDQTNSISMRRAVNQMILDCMAQQLKGFESGFVTIGTMVVVSQAIDLMD